MILFILGFNYDATKVFACIKYKLHLVESLKANILIGNKIFCTKRFSVNF